MIPRSRDGSGGFACTETLRGNKKGLLITQKAVSAGNRT